MRKARAFSCFDCWFALGVQALRRAVLSGSFVLRWGLDATLSGAKY